MLPLHFLHPDPQVFLSPDDMAAHMAVVMSDMEAGRAADAAAGRTAPDFVPLGQIPPLPAAAADVAAATTAAADAAAATAAAAPTARSNPDADAPCVSAPPPAPPAPPAPPPPPSCVAEGGVVPRSQGPAAEAKTEAKTETEAEAAGTPMEGVEEVGGVCEVAGGAGGDTEAMQE